MKLKPEFITHNLDGEQYMICTDRKCFNGMVKSNDTAAFIIECLKNDTTEKSITDKMMTEYSGVERSIVEKNVADMIAKLRSIGALAE